MGYTHPHIKLLVLVAMFVGIIFMNLNWGLTLDLQTQQTNQTKHTTEIILEANNKHSVYSKYNTKHLWRFYNKEIPSLYDVFTNASTLIFIFQTKKGHCRRCISDNAAQLPLIEYDADGDKRVGMPRWECRFPTETVAGSVIKDPHGHIFVLICPGIPSVPRVDVHAQAEGEEILIYNDIEYEPRHEKRQYKLAACTMVKSDAAIDALMEWVKYHRIQGWDHFSMYVDGPVERIADAFQDDNWTVSVVDWHWPDSGFQHQQAEMNSCLYRYRGSAEWVAFFDMDEFFQPITTTILEILGKVPGEYGGWAAQHVLFIPPPNIQRVDLTPVTQTFMERRTDPLPFPERSKCIVRPYEVDTMGVHEITSGNTLTWVANPTEEARLNHYKVGLDSYGALVYDTSMRQYANTLQLTKYTKRRPFVAVYLIGQLGNQLFQAASSYGMALARGADWCIPYLNGSILERSVHFSLPPLSNCVPEGVHVAHEAGDFLRFQAWMLHEHPGESMLVGTYLQSFHYFANVSRLPFELREQVRANEWVHKNDIMVGIHVRRTDMLHNLGNDPTIEYFKEALARMRDAVGPIHTKNIVVCTDDPTWVHAHIEVFGGMNVRANTNYYEDMAVLAGCQHLILSIGTFGWWAAYLRASPGHTFYFAEPLQRPPSSYVEHFPVSWTPISLTHVSELTG
jgi:galactoside 2-L-fucosyltransferase 1/2